MADAVTTKTIFNGHRKLVMQFLSRSDGTGESGVTKVDKSTYVDINGIEPTSLVIERIEGEVSGMEVLVYVDHTSDENLLRLSSGIVKLDYRSVGGLQTNGAGDTGDILFSTNLHAAGDTYNLTFYMRKKS